MTNYSKKIKTNHPEIGYTNNIQIIEQALREEFLTDDQSYILTAVAAHIWSKICGKYEKEWGATEIKEAIEQCNDRLKLMSTKMGWQMPGGVTECACMDKGCAIGYPHARH